MTLPHLLTSLGSFAVLSLGFGVLLAVVVEDLPAILKALRGRS